VTPPPEVITPDVGNTFEIKDNQVVVTEYHTYTVAEKPEELVLPDNYVKTVLMIDEIQVPAYVKQGEKPEEFLLVVLKNEAGEVNWYRYDRIEQTLQRVNEEEYVVTQVIQSNDESLKVAIQQYEMYQSILIVAASALVGICLILLMIILVLSIRRRNRG